MMKVKDPVCRMEIEKEKAQFKAKKGAKEFFFCSKNCYDTFTGQKLK